MTSLVFALLENLLLAKNHSDHSRSAHHGQNADDGEHSITVGAGAGQLEHPAVRHGVVEDVTPVERRVAAGYVLPVVLREEFTEKLPIILVDSAV